MSLIQKASTSRDERGKPGASGEFGGDATRRLLLAAEEAERRRLSRELHDQLGQHMTAISLGLHEVSLIVGSASPAFARLTALHELAILLTRDVRYLATELRPPELDDVGLESAMTSYAEQWTKRYGIPVQLQTVGLHDDKFSDAVATTLFRVMQEALTNVAKHANARECSVIAEQTDDELRMIVEDDGQGFKVEAMTARAVAEQRIGLAGMRERVALVGGTLAIESDEHRGTTVFVRVPVP